MKTISTSLKKIYSFIFFVAIGFVLALVITFFIKLISIIVLFAIGLLLFTTLDSWNKNKFRKQ